MKEGNIKKVPLIEKTLLGEGAFWDAKNNKLRFCDIEGKKMWSIDYTSGQEEVNCDMTCDDKVGAYVMRSDGGYLIGHQWAFDLLDEKCTKFDQVAGYLDANYEETSISHKQGGRLNDGRCDRQGRFVCGGYNDLNEDGKARDKLQKVWQLQKAAEGEGKHGVKCEQFFDFQVSCTNSICWSPDGKTMYFSDSFDRQLLAFDYDTVTGKASNKRVFFDFEKEKCEGVADGATVDTKGGIWVAIFGGGRVVRFDPVTAKITYEVKVPKCSAVTCPAIGGKNLDTLFITTHGTFASEEDRKAGGPEENAGCMFMYGLPADYRGIPETPFQM